MTVDTEELRTRYLFQSSKEAFDICELCDALDAAESETTTAKSRAFSAERAAALETIKLGRALLERDAALKCVAELEALAVWGVFGAEARHMDEPLRPATVADIEVCLGAMKGQDVMDADERERVRQHMEANEESGHYHCSCLDKRVAELEAERRAALRIGHEVTLETQTLEEMATELVRLVRQAREERDAAGYQADYDKLTKLVPKGAASVVSRVVERVAELERGWQDPCPHGCADGACPYIRRASKALKGGT